MNAGLDNHNTVRQRIALDAAKNYASVLEALDSPSKSKDMFLRYQNELRRDAADVGQSLTALNFQPELSLAECIRRDHLEVRLKTLGKTIEEISRRSQKIIQALQTKYSGIHSRLREEIIPSLSNITEKTKDHAFYKAMYKAGSEDLYARYVPTDQLFDAGLEDVFDGDKYKDRLYRLLLRPNELRHAQWELMLSLSNAAYKILPPDESPTLLKTIAFMYTRLSENERGSDNKTVPSTHKLRHGPANHSLHSCELADKIFHKSKKRIQDLHLTANVKADTLNELSAIRQEVMLQLIVHDMGEIEGEIGQGIKEAEELTKDQARKLKVDKAVIEKAMFEKHLDIALGALSLSDKDSKKIKSQLEHAYAGSEKDNMFTGRLTTVLEKMNSGHDIVRFNELGKAQKLRNTSLRNKAFSQFYVFRKLFDIQQPGDEPGKNALQHLKSDPATTQGIAEQAIYDEVMSELNIHNERQSMAYRMAPLTLNPKSNAR